MQEPDRPSEQINQIHAIMARSTTFVSLSGFSGVCAGILAFMAFWRVGRMLDTIWLDEKAFTVLRDEPILLPAIAVVFLVTLVLALAVAFFFTWRRAKHSNLELWNIASRRFGMHMALPLLAGGVFILALARLGTFELICPAMLVFFGLALINAGKYSVSGTELFGVVELVLGLLAAFWVEAGLILWVVGFGLVTAGHGVLMYLQHER